jgi:hypothetical protein
VIKNGCGEAKFWGDISALDIFFAKKIVVKGS